MWLDRLGRQGMDYWVRAAGMGFGSAIAMAELGERFLGRLADDQRVNIELAFGTAARHYGALAALIAPPARPTRPSKTARLALVTGARGVLGTTVCERLAASGFRVAATFPSSDTASARRWRYEQARQGYDFAIVACDIARYEDCTRLACWAERRFGAVDILVHITDLGSNLGSADKGHWRTILDDGLDGVYNLARNLIPGMSGHHYGRIIVVVVAGGPSTDLPAPPLTAARAGILGFTRALARELQDRGITVNTVSAGCSRTVPEDTSRAILRALDLSHLEQPEEIAKAVAFLAADEQCAYTGHDVASQRRPESDPIVDFTESPIAFAKRRSCDRLFAS